MPAPDRRSPRPTATLGRSQVGTDGEDAAWVEPLDGLRIAIVHTGCERFVAEGAGWLARTGVVPLINARSSEKLAIFSVRKARFRAGRGRFRVKETSDGWISVPSR